MNVDNEVDVGRFLAQIVIQLYSYHILNRGIGSCWTSILYAVCEEGMAPRERGPTAECVSEEALPRIPLHVFQVAMCVDVKRCHFNASVLDL